jgi:ubiquinone/menaquinone biosynthesis C-methylase UbiE
LHSLRCPESGQQLTYDPAGVLRSANGQQYPVVQGIPVLLTDRPSTLWVADASKRVADGDPYRVDTLGINDQERQLLRAQLVEHDRNQFPVDPVISALIFATGGHMYADFKHRLPRVPIPEIRLERSGEGARLLDIGCNWGRWSIAAARKGYKVLGVDPSLGAVLAAKRLAKAEGFEIDFVVADARSLPFRSNIFDTVFSYSVLQHFSRHDAEQTIGEVARILSPGGLFKCQMASAFGIRSFSHVARRGFRAPKNFEVRYYSPRQLTRMFSQGFAKVDLDVDGYFGLGIQPSDSDLLPPFERAVARTSEFLRRGARRVPLLKYCADSVYIEARRGDAQSQ